jgi:hypothetical protein
MHAKDYIGRVRTPDKPKPELTAKTKKEPKKIEFGTQELTKVKTRIS